MVNIDAVSMMVCNEYHMVLQQAFSPHEYHNHMCGEYTICE